MYCTRVLAPSSGILSARRFLSLTTLFHCLLISDSPNPRDTVGVVRLRRTRILGFLFPVQHPMVKTRPKRLRSDDTQTLIRELSNPSRPLVFSYLGSCYPTRLTFHQIVCICLSGQVGCAFMHKGRPSVTSRLAQRQGPSDPLITARAAVETTMTYLQLLHGSRTGALLACFPISGEGHGAKLSCSRERVGAHGQVDWFALTWYSRCLSNAGPI